VEYVHSRVKLLLVSSLARFSLPPFFCPSPSLHYTDVDSLFVGAITLLACAAGSAPTTSSAVGTSGQNSGALAIFQGGLGLSVVVSFVDVLVVPRCSKAHSDLGIGDVKPRKHADETEKERWSLLLMHVKRLGEFHARRMSWRIIYGQRRMLHTHAFFHLPRPTPCLITVLPNTQHYGSTNENGLYLLPMISVLLPITLQQTALQPPLFIEQDYYI
jgi:hypothetical protein